MENLEIIDLYENSNKERNSKFINNLNSSLNVKTDVKKITRDIEWISIMEFTIPYIDNIFRSPNRFIINEEEIVKIEQAKKVTVETIKHLSKNTNFIQTVDQKTGDVTPSKLLNVRKEETYNTYENRLIYTLVNNMKLFIKRRKEFLQQEAKIQNNKNDDNIDNKKLEYKASSKIDGENVNINFELDSSNDLDDGDLKNSVENILEKIEEVERKITSLEATDVYRTIEKSKVAEVREPVKKTNVILKNVNFQYAMKLWDYLRDNFEDKTAKIEENQDYMDEGKLKSLIDETFLIQYLSLKTLDDDKIENEPTHQELQNIVLDQLIDKMIDMNMELTDEQLGNLIAEKYQKIKYKKFAIIQEINKIFKKHFERYLENIEEKGEK